MESDRSIIIIDMLCSRLFLYFSLFSNFACNYEKENKVEVLAATPIANDKIQDYPEHIKKTIKVRDSLSRLFNSSSADQKGKILKDAAILFTEVMTNEIFPPWYGTKWDFNGTTQVPGKGYIACGYFVTTTLRDAGLKIQRIKTAQQAAEVIVSVIASKESTKRFSDSPIDAIKKSMKERGDGLYIVGLDYHVGFLQQIGDTTWFIHSNYLNRSGVMKESPWENSVFYHSRYKVIAKIDDDRKVLENWLRKPRT